MASANAQQTHSPNFFLTPQQQDLLFAALNSNKPSANQSPASKPLSSMSPNSFQTSPILDNGVNGYPNAGLPSDFDYDFGDSTLDFGDISADQSGAQLIGDLPGSNNSSKSESPENDAHEKRSHPDDEADDEEGANGAKRRESSDKVAKKPGRKPLTSEPTNKRKAQNRAAQRAFRERKEKHVKDLETKVEELEKASKDANHENGILRAQVDRMTTELNEYKSRLTMMNNRPAMTSNRANNSFGSSFVGNLNDVNFHFDFPKFGGPLPGPTNNSKPSTQKSSPAAVSPTGKSITSPQMDQRRKENSLTSQLSSGSFNAEKEAAGLASFFDPAPARVSMSTSRASTDSVSYNGNNGTNTSSPSASSLSNAGPSSSCGTSPEPNTQSPMGFKPVDTMTTIGEEQSGLTSGQENDVFSGIDTNFDWLSQQNGGQFDPQLFNNYREPQDNILAGANLDESFFNDAIDADFFLPYNTGVSSHLQKQLAAQAQHQTNILDEIDAQNADDSFQTKQPSKSFGCNDVWDELQKCPKVQAGEFDLDGLCSELQMKAKCSGKGPVVSETDFQSVVDKWMGKKCADDVLKNTQSTA